MSVLKSKNVSLLLVIPMYNEDERVNESFDRLIDYIKGRASGSHLLFVDDGSTDRTVEVVARAIESRGRGFAAVLCGPHAGKGAAIRAGLARADTDLAAFCDVDLATPLDQLDLIVDEAFMGSCLAIGSRAMRDSSIHEHESLRRELAGKAFNHLVRSWLCQGISDTQCGAKAAPTTVWQAVLPHSFELGFAWDVEAIALAFRLGIPVRELGIHWTHDERTRVRVLRDGLSMVLAVPRITLSVWRVPRTRKIAYNADPDRTLRS